MVLRNNELDFHPTIYLKSGYRAIIARTEEPFTAFIVSERFLVDAVEEFLRRRFMDSHDIDYKEIAIKKIKQLILDIEAKMIDFMIPKRKSNSKN